MSGETDSAAFRAISISEFDAWLIAALPGQQTAYLNGEYAPRNFAVAKAVRDADAAGLVHCFFNARHAPPAYMAQRTSKRLPPGFTPRVDAPAPMPSPTPADAEAVLAVVECSVGSAGILPPLHQIARRADLATHRVRAAIAWLIAAGMIIVQSLIIGTQRQRWVILS